MKGKAGVEVGGDCVCQLGWDGRGSARWNWVGSTKLAVPGQSYRLDEGCYLELVTKVVIWNFQRKLLSAVAESDKAS